MFNFMQFEETLSMPELTAFLDCVKVKLKDKLYKLTIRIPVSGNPYVTQNTKEGILSYTCKQLVSKGDGYEIWQEKVFRELITKLGVPWELPTTDLEIVIQDGEMVKIYHTYFGSVTI